MIELTDDSLSFSFPEVHHHAKLSINFQRTLRIPDDGSEYSLPPGLGRFPLRHVDDFATRVAPKWLEHGGVMLPMYQSEAMWIYFNSSYNAERGTHYPFAIKIAAGKINAVTGQSWTRNLHSRPQDYVVAPTQPWLDGFCVRKGIIRQFVAMPLGQGYTAEEQISDTAEHGGVQVIVYPMKRDVFERRFPKIDLVLRERFTHASMAMPCAAPMADMGLGAGGQMRQEIYDDPYTYDDWDQTNSARCFIHIANSEMWEAITGDAPPTKPISAAEYSKAGLPWFNYYDEKAKAAAGSAILDGLKSVADLWRHKKATPLPDNDPVKPEVVVELRKGMRKGQVREGAF